MSDIASIILAAIGGGAQGYGKQLEEKKQMELAKAKNSQSLLNNLFQTYAKSNFDAAAANGQAPDFNSMAEQLANLQNLGSPKDDSTNVGLSAAVGNSARKNKLSLANVPPDDVLPQFANGDPAAAPKKVEFDPDAYVAKLGVK